MQDTYFFRSNIPQNTYCQSWTRERMTRNQMFGHPQLTTYTANFILKQQAKRFAQFKMHLFGQSAYIVMTLDHRTRDRQRLDAIGINSSLCQPFHIFQFMSFRIKYIDKTFTYYLAFTFRLGNTFQFRKKLSTGIHTDYIQTETLIIVHHILELVFTKHTVIHKDTSQILTDRLIQQNSSYRRIHSAAQTQHNLVITQLCLQLGNRTFDERSRRPVLFATANIHYEIFQNLRTVFTVVYLRMELHAPHLFTLNLISSNFHFVGRSDLLEV